MQRLSLRKWVSRPDFEDAGSTFGRERHITSVRDDEHTTDPAPDATPESEQGGENAQAMSSTQVCDDILPERDVELASGVNPCIRREEEPFDPEPVQDAPFEFAAFIAQRWGMSPDASAELLMEWLGSYVPSTEYEISLLGHPELARAENQTSDQLLMAV